MKRKPTLVLDFDGVIHGYASGWKGPRTIPDAPVPGALQFIVEALDQFNLCVSSSRSHYWFGRMAMRRYLHRQLVAAAGSDFSDTPEWWAARISRTAFADPWKDEVGYAATCVVNEIGWPLHKPPAFVTIDDRALTFTGEWPTLGDLAAFKTWMQRA